MKVIINKVTKEKKPKRALTDVEMKAWLQERKGCIFAYRECNTIEKDETVYILCQLGTDEFGLNSLRDGNRYYDTKNIRYIYTYIKEHFKQIGFIDTVTINPVGDL